MLIFILSINFLSGVFSFEWVFEALEKHINLRELLENNEKIMNLVTKEELNELFSYEYVFKNIDKIYDACGIEWGLKWNLF